MTDVDLLRYSECYGVLLFYANAHASLTRSKSLYFVSE